jgi:replicative DNA helicase
VIGCILMDALEALGKCADRFQTADVFYDLRHQTIYAAACEMLEKLIPVDVVTLAQWLKDRNMLEEVGGIAYLGALPDLAPSPSGIDHYVAIVHDKYLLRGMIRACTEATSSIYGFEGDVAAIIDQVERDILRVRQAGVLAKNLSARQLVSDAMNAIEDMHSRAGKLSGIPTGFADLDKLTWGLQNGDMIVIAARPSMGKTSLAMNIVEHAAVDHQRPVGVFSLEMTAQSLMMRMICSRARVNARNVREGFLADRDFPKLSNAALKLGAAPIHIDDASGLSIMQLRAKARRMWQQFGIQLFVIDYMQLLNNATDRRRADNRQQEVADISAGIKAMAKELGVPVIVLSQLNRDIEREKHRRPRLADLRESGAVEQDADVVGLLYRTASEDGSEDNGYEEAIPVNLLIAKQRNGPTGDVNLTFLKSYTRFESAAKVSDDQQAELHQYRGHADP